MLGTVLRMLSLVDTAAACTCHAKDSVLCIVPRVPWLVDAEASCACHTKLKVSPKVTVQECGTLFLSTREIVNYFWAKPVFQTPDYSEYLAFPMESELLFGDCM